MQLQPFRLWAAVLVLLLLASSNSASSFGQDTQTETVPSFPPGALANFPEVIHPGNQKLEVKVLIRPDVPGNQPVWLVASQEVLLADTKSTVDKNTTIKTESGIGFIVPQLPKGIYVAWYETGTTSQHGQSMKLMIVPELLADEGITRGLPGGDVEVRVRIHLTTIHINGRPDPVKISVPVVLQSENPSAADLAAPQSRTVTTNSDGRALWKVHIKTAGVTQFRATAENFEPVVIEVVGMPTSAPTFREAELIVAESHASELEGTASEAAARVTELEKAAADSEKQANAQIADVSVGKKRSEAEIRARIGEIKSELEKRKVIVDQARETSRESQKEAVAARAVARTLAEQLPTLQPPSVGEAALKAGDILLVLGSTPLVSSLIRQFEEQQLGGRASYSHASLYLGKIDGTGMVAEMWSSGYGITPLSESTKGAVIVDVYRWEGIDDAKRQEIADRASSLYGPRANFTSSVGPPTGSRLPYAFEEIGVLAAAANNVPEFVLRQGVTRLVDPLAGGRRKMICSELVAWVYRDVGLDLEVSYWKRLLDANLLTTDDRRKDYTTPNMLARSKSLKIMGRYLGP